MGKMISKCLESRSKRYQDDDDEPDFYRKMSLVAPFEVSDLNQVAINETLNKFYCIPNEGQIDKVIEWLDEAHVYTEKEIAMLNDVIVELESLRKKYRPTLLYIRRETQASKSVHSLLEANKSVSSESHEGGVKLSGSFISSDSLSANDDGKEKAHFMVEVQSAKFLHESLLQKHALSNPYVEIKIYRKPYVRLDASGPLPSSMIKTIKTKKSMELLEPKWDELYRYYLDLEKEEQDKVLSTYSVGISLYYSGRKNEEDWRVGEEQHFSFSSLVDQRMQSKIIDFKDSELKGVLAKLHIKIQLVSNREQVITRVLHEIDIRLEKLGKLKQKQPGTATRTQDDKSRSSSMADHSQSMMSAYSYTGLKANDYYIV